MALIVLRQSVGGFQQKGDERATFARLRLEVTVHAIKLGHRSMLADVDAGAAPPSSKSPATKATPC
jgi:hypothetical protein